MREQKEGAAAIRLNALLPTLPTALLCGSPFGPVRGAPLPGCSRLVAPYGSLSLSCRQALRDEARKEGKTQKHRDAKLERRISLLLEFLQTSQTNKLFRVPGRKILILPRDCEWSATRCRCRLRGPSGPRWCTTPSSSTQSSNKVLLHLHLLLLLSSSSLLSSLLFSLPPLFLLSSSSLCLLSSLFSLLLSSLCSLLSSLLSSSHTSQTSCSAATRSKATDSWPRFL